MMPKSSKTSFSSFFEENPLPCVIFYTETHNYISEDKTTITKLVTVKSKLNSEFVRIVESFNINDADYVLNQTDIFSLLQIEDKDVINKISAAIISYHDITIDKLFFLNNVYKLIIRNIYKNQFGLILSPIKDFTEEDKRKNDFIANITHEIRTPLNGIICFSSSLQGTKLTKKQKEYVNELKQCTVSLMSIINDVLDNSSMQSNKLQINMLPMILRSCIADTMGMMKKTAEKKGLEYDYEIAPNVPSIIVSDQNRIKQILSNLLSNALKFTNKGYIKVRVNSSKTIKTPRDGRSENSYLIKIDVIDTGVGISKTDIPKLFKPYCKLENTTNRGAGLGLSICESLIKLLGGEIYCISEEGKGSCFTFTLPCNRSVDPGLILADRKQDLKGKYALIVHPDQTIRMKLSQWFSKWDMIPIITEIKDASSYKNGKLSFSFILNGYTDDLKLLFPDSSVLDMTDIIKDGVIDECNLMERLCSVKTKQPRKIVIEPKSSKIMIVEDIISNQKVLSLYLKKLGYKDFIICSSGIECLSTIRNNPQLKIDIIFMDLLMPGIDGVETVRQLKIMMKDLPYIICQTAKSASVDDVSGYLSLGFSDFIQKPISSDILRYVLNKAENKVK